MLPTIANNASAAAPTLSRIDPLRTFIMSSPLKVPAHVRKAQL